MALDLSTYLHQAFNGSREMWQKDLAAFSPEDLVRKAAPSARSAAEIAYEIVIENRASAMFLRGEDPGPYLGFPACPSEMANKECLVNAISESVEEVLAAIGDPERTIVTHHKTETAFEHAMFVRFHMDYHLGQINMLHTLYGDTKIHWG